MHILRDVVAPWLWRERPTRPAADVLPSRARRGEPIRRHEMHRELALLAAIATAKESA